MWKHTVFLSECSFLAPTIYPSILPTNRSASGRLRTAHTTLTTHFLEASDKQQRTSHPKLISYGDRFEPHHNLPSTAFVYTIKVKTIHIVHSLRDTTPRRFELYYSKSEEIPTHLLHNKLTKH